MILDRNVFVIRSKASSYKYLTTKYDLSDSLKECALCVNRITAKILLETFSKKKKIDVDDYEIVSFEKGYEI